LKKRPVQGFPKTTAEWLPFALKTGLRLVKSQKYEVIVSSALPFVGHLVGYLLVRRSKVPWVADYGDSIGFNPMTSRTKRFIGRHIEKFILQNVQGIVVPFEEMSEEFLEFYPFLKKQNFRVIGQGISKDFNAIEPWPSKKKFVISYVGSFYKKAHEPTQFFQALSLIKEENEFKKNIEVIVAGNTEQRYIKFAKKLNIKDMTQFLGQVAYEKAISLLKGSSATLYIGGKRKDYHFPYKITELIASAKPIICIRQSNSDLGANFIEKNRLGLVVANDKEKIAEALRTLLNRWNNQTLKTSFKHLPKDNLYWSVQAKKLDEFLTSLLN
jgi:hypothetical protein